MNISQTINQTRENIKRIRDYLDCLEYNNNEKAEELTGIIARPIDDVQNALEFIRDYNKITKEIADTLKSYYGER